MKWEDSTAAKCRYGDEVGAAFNKPIVLWERSYADYQGHAKVLCWDQARVVYYEWGYGSCSGCDNWEAQGLEGEKLVLTIRAQGEYFEDAEVLKKFFGPIYAQQGSGYGDEVTVNVTLDDLIESARLYLAEARENDPQDTRES